MATLNFQPIFTLEFVITNTATKRNDEEKQFHLMENFHKFRPFHCQSQPAYSYNVKSEKFRKVSG